MYFSVKINFIYENEKTMHLYVIDGEYELYKLIRSELFIAISWEFGCQVEIVPTKEKIYPIQCNVLIAS